MKMPLTAVLVALLALTAMTKQAQAQCPTSDLGSCIPAAEADVEPTDSCCTNLTPYAETGEVCLCEAAASLSDLQFAVKIPAKCNLVYKSGITCNGIVIPGGY